MFKTWKIKKSLINKGFKVKIFKVEKLMKCGKICYKKVNV